jgi:hypothetical protein
MGEKDFEKLNDSNYPMWKYRMEMLLIKMDLWEIVKGTKTLPPGNPGTAAVRSFLKKQKLARAEIALKVDDSQLVYTKKEDPKEIWDKLENVHMARGLATRLALRRRFHSMSKDDLQSMQSYIAIVQDVARRLEDLGAKISDEEIILALTEGLPQSYESLIVSLDATLPDQLNVDHVITRLLNEEARQGGPEFTEHSETVLMAKKGKSFRPGRRNLKDVTCYRCGKTGHYKSHCTEKTAERAQFAVAF